MGDWDERFGREGALWGEEPSVGAAYALGYFAKKGVRTVLDVACGYGKDSVYLARRFDVTGIDSSAVGIRMANERALREGVMARFLRGDVRAMQFPSGSFDGVLCNGILAHMLNAERPRVAGEIERVLRKGGALVVSEFSESRKPEGAEEVESGTYRERDGMAYHYFGREELRALFPSVKFEHAKEQRKGGGSRLKWVMAGVRK